MPAEPVIDIEDGDSAFTQRRQKTDTDPTQKYVHWAKHASYD